MCNLCNVCIICTGGVKNNAKQGVKLMSKPILASCPRFWAQRGYQLHDRLITYMSLNQNSTCDAKCAGCFRYPERKCGLTSLLSMPDYERLLGEFARLGGLAIEISGEGEPLLSPLTLPIIRLASQLGIWTTLITNCHKLTLDLVKELRSLNVALVMSLHSLSREVYEKDSGVVGSYDVKLQAINFVSQVFSGTEWVENGRTIKHASVHWTLQADNLEEVENVRRFCDERGLHFSIAPLAHTGHAATRPDLWLPESLTRLEAVNALGDESIIFYDEPDGRSVCGTCKYGLNIGADGNLLLDAHGGYEVQIANIRNVDFEEAIRLQHCFSKKTFDTLSCFCPVRDARWQEFLARKEYL